MAKIQAQLCKGNKVFFFVIDSHSSSQEVGVKKSFLPRQTAITRQVWFERYAVFRKACPYRAIIIPAAERQIAKKIGGGAVSYTHLTLPTKRIV